LLVLKRGILSVWAFVANLLAVAREKFLQLVGKFLDWLMNRKTESTSAGRPTVDDQSLSTHRNSIVDMLSCWWGEIGWQLPRATTREELRTALAPLTDHPNRYRISRLLLVSSGSATAEEIREERQAYEKVIGQIYEADARQRERRELVRQTQMALGQASPEQTEAVKAQVSKREAELQAAINEYDGACAAQRELEKRLDQMEACFAQDELLKFIETRLIKGRYARNPRNLADAMAGLPYTQGVRFMGAWQSYARCSKLPCSPHFRFQVFETIQSIWKKAHKSKLPTVDFFHQEVTALPKIVALKTVDQLTEKEVENKVGNTARSHLLDNWAIWNLAIKKSLASQVEPERMPFLICANFTEVQKDPKTSVAIVLGAAENTKN
jgi:hypothetical protein